MEDMNIDEIMAGFEVAKVKIGKLEVELIKPSPLFSLAVSHTQTQIDGATKGQKLAWAAASLAACWPKDRAWPIQPRPRPWGAGVKVETYGHKVFDDLLLGGCDLGEVLTAGTSAHRLAVESLLSQSELQAARDLLRARLEDISRRPTESAETTDSPPIGGTD